MTVVHVPRLNDAHRSRAEARYDSGTDTASASYNRSSSGRIGSLGYGATVERDPQAERTGPLRQRELHTAERA